MSGRKALRGYLCHGSPVESNITKLPNTIFPLYDILSRAVGNLVFFRGDDNNPSIELLIALSCWVEGPVVIDPQIIYAEK